MERGEISPLWPPLTAPLSPSTEPVNRFQRFISSVFCIFSVSQGLQSDTPYVLVFLLYGQSRLAYCVPTISCLATYPQSRPACSVRLCPCCPCSAIPYVQPLSGCCGTVSLSAPYTQSSRASVWDSACSLGISSHKRNII